MRTTIGHENVRYEIKAFFVNGKDTVIPRYRIDKAPYNTDFINPKDSMLFIIKIVNFPDWQNKWINTDVSLDDIISMLRLEYSIHPEERKSEFRPVRMDFDIKPQHMYVIPPSVGATTYYEDPF